MNAELHIEMTFHSSCSNCKRNLYVMDHCEEVNFLRLHQTKSIEIECACGFIETVTWSGKIEQEAVTLELT